MSSLGDGCITTGYRYVYFNLTVVYLVVFLLLLIQNTIVFFSVLDLLGYQFHRHFRQCRVVNLYMCFLLI